MKKLLCQIAFISIRLFYSFVLCIALFSHSLAQEMSIRIYTAKDGLPSTFTFNAYQDKIGYLWIGTTDGLSRFDGKYFTNYGLAEGLPDIRTNGGLMDSHLRYWASTTRGVVEFKGNQFINYPLSDTLNIRWVFQVLETKAGQLWSLTDKGVYHFVSNKWVKLKLYPGYENHPCRNIVESNDGIYINYGDIVVYSNKIGNYRVLTPVKSPEYYYNTLIKSSGEIFISSLDGIYKITNHQLVKLPGMGGELKGLYTFFVDSKKRIWIGNSQDGIRYIDPSDPITFRKVYKQSLDMVPQQFSEDSQGNIWVSSGIGLLRIAELNFKLYPELAIGGKGIFNMIQSKQGLLINNGTFTLQQFNNNSGSVYKLLGKGFRSTDELIIDEYAIDEKERLWYVLRTAEIAMQDGNKIYNLNEKLAGLGNEVFDVLYDKWRNKIMVAVGTQKFPCQLTDFGANILATENHIEVKGDLRRLHQCANGNILFATDEGLVYSINKKNICRLQLNEFSTESVISKFYNDPSGDTWILYNGRGLRRYYWKGDSLIFKEYLNKTNGLSTDNVSAMCFDNNNNLWVSNNTDVTVFSRKINNQPYKIIEFFEAEALQINGAFDVRMTKDKIGNIWLFTREHLVCFFPDKINYNPPVPSIVIEKLELNLHPTKWLGFSDSLSGILQVPLNPKIPYNKNSISIYFKGISSSGTEGIKYSYQLQGLQELWSNPISSDFVSFVNLSPGKYIFKVKAQLPNSNWSAPALFSFEIKKAWWQTWWFYLFTAMLVSACIYWLFRYRLSQKIKLLEMRNRFSQDLHDEIGASMSGINLLSQMASEKLEQQHPEEAAGYMVKVNNYTQDVIEKLSDMVWIFNPQNDSIEKLMERLKTFSISIAASKNIQVHFESDKEMESINLSIRQRKAIYLISKEAINNCFKYAACNHIYYSLHAMGSGWRLSIRDDGIGFYPAESRNGNGLKNMQARATEINAKLNIQSQPGKGMILTLEI